MKLFLKSLLANMMFRMGWALAAALCFVLHKLMNIPSCFTFIFLGIWILISLTVTAMLWMGKGPVKNREDIKLPPYGFGKNRQEKKTGKNPDTPGFTAEDAEKKDGTGVFPTEEVFDMDTCQYIGCVIDYQGEKMTVVRSLNCYEGDFFFLMREDGSEIRVSAFDYDLMESLPDPDDIMLTERNGKVFYGHGGTTYELTSHPYEPCLYIKKDGEIFRTLHNAFDAEGIVDTFAKGRTLLGINGQAYDKTKFCRVLAASVDGNIAEMNFTDVAAF